MDPIQTEVEEDVPLKVSQHIALQYILNLTTEWTNQVFEGLIFSTSRNNLILRQMNAL